MTTEETTYHLPVLLRQSVDGLNIKKDGKYVDVTFGGGGHSMEILSRLEGKAHLYAFDQDADAEANVTESNQFTFVRSNFRYLKNFLKYHGETTGIDGLLADLGVSSHHFDDAERGFSFRFNAPLDMRMNQSAKTTAADIVNNYDEKRLADLFYLYGELKHSRQIASAIIQARKTKHITTTEELMAVVQPFIGRDREKKDLAKVFQALRIEVNHEMDALREMLNAATEMLKPGGRLVVITYHSLEDRMVKNMMKTGTVEGEENKDFYGKTSSPYKLITRKPIVPDEEEQESNPRSRSAKLRIAERIKDE